MFRTLTNVLSVEINEYYQLCINNKFPSKRRVGLGTDGNISSEERIGY